MVSSLEDIYALLTPEKEMATHSSVLAWEISRPEKPDEFYSMGS